MEIKYKHPFTNEQMTKKDYFILMFGAEFMARVEVWVIEDIKYRRNLRFLNNIKRHLIRYGDR